jgi:hypothetical protein
VYPEGASCSRRDAVAPAKTRREASGLGRPRAGSIEELGAAVIGVLESLERISKVLNIVPMMFNNLLHREVRR